MTSFIEQIVEGFGNLSSIMQAGLAEVRSKDETTRNLLKAINKEEIDLLEELKLLAKNNPDFDEEPLKARAQHLISRRRDVSLILDDQNKFSIGIYHHLDQKIKDFDVSSKGIVHLFPDSGNTLETDETRRKKKRRSSNSRTLMNSDSQVRPEDERLDTLSVFDTVLYCTCRRPDFGQKMVACSNDDCPISHEWFHYGCVGLSEDWLQNECDWFCSMCRDPSSSFICRDLSKPPLADSSAMASAATDWKDPL